jgi:hypothetical protein
MVHPLGRIFSLRLLDILPCRGDKVHIYNSLQWAPLQALSNSAKGKLTC